MDKQINKAKRDTERVEHDLETLSKMDKKFDKKIDKAEKVIKHKRTATAHQMDKKASKSKREA